MTPFHAIIYCPGPRMAFCHGTFIRPSGCGTVKGGEAERTRKLQIELTVALARWDGRTDDERTDDGSAQTCSSVLFRRRLLCWMFPLFPLCYWDLLPVGRLARKGHVKWMDIAALLGTDEGMDLNPTSAPSASATNRDFQSIYKLIEVNAQLQCQWQQQKPFCHAPRCASRNELINPPSRFLLHSPPFCPSTVAYECLRGKEEPPDGGAELQTSQQTNVVETHCSENEVIRPSEHTSSQLHNCLSACP